MNVNEYYESLMSHIYSLAEVDGQFIENQFLEFALELLVDAGEFEEFQIIEDGRDGGGRWRIDALGYDTDSYTLNLFISVFEQSETPSNLTQTDLNGLIKKLYSFIDVSLKKDPYVYFEPTSQVCEAAVEIKNKWEILRQFKFFIISNKPASKRIDNLPPVDILGVKAQPIIWDLNRLFELEQSGKEREEMVIDFSASPLKCLVTSESNDDLQSILAVIPGSTLFELYDKWGARLLEQNVRSYLQNRSKVNKGIRLTIKDEPERFFAYNNGLTTTAEAVEFTDSARTAIKSLKNLQIVNGGQTTSSIYASVIADKLDVSKVSVQMKLSVVEPEKVGELVPFISRYANSQNKVSDADLFSNHPFHVHFEGLSRRLVSPPKPGGTISTKWFYERARGQYLDQQAYLTQSKRKAFQQQNPRSQLLTKTDLAKIENSWRMLPADVSKGAQANFGKFAEFIDKQWTANPNYFGEAYFKKCVVHALIFRDLEKYIQKTDWYAGFRANIVTYTVSLFSHHLIQQNKSLNYDHLYRSQYTPDRILQALEKIAIFVDSNLKSFSGNLTTYAKGASAWKNMTEKLTAPDFTEIESFLWDQKSLQDFDTESKATAKIDGQLGDEMKVRLLTPEQWALVKQLVIDLDEATDTKISLINRAIAMQNLTDKQCAVLAKLVNQYEDIKGKFEVPQ